MKKYIRLAIVLISFFSIVSMLVYRYKYHSLRSLEEIMDFFISKPTNKCHLKHSSEQLPSEIIFNLSHWTEIFSGIYVYSSHIISNYVISLGYSSGVSVSKLKSISCNLWFENKGIYLESKLDIHLLNGKNGSFLFHMNCKQANDLGKPDAVTFMKNNISKTIPLFHKKFYSGSYAACVSPLSTVFSDENRIVEFLIYHSNLGIKHFIFYYTALSVTVKELVINLSHKCDIVIEFLPWIPPTNFQLSKIKLQPYFIDCIFHAASLNHSEFLFLLDLNKFVVLQEASTLKELISSNSPFDFLQLHQSLFCLEYPNYIIAEELNINFKTLLKTKVSQVEGQQLNVIYDLKQMLKKVKQTEGFKKWLLTKNMQNLKEIKSSASIFSYADCGLKLNDFSNVSYSENKKMWSFKRAFLDSCIFKLTKTI